MHKRIRLTLLDR